MELFFQVSYYNLKVVSMVTVYVYRIIKKQIIIIMFKFDLVAITKED